MDNQFFISFYVNKNIVKYAQASIRFSLYINYFAKIVSRYIIAGIVSTLTSVDAPTNRAPSFASPPNSSVNMAVFAALGMEAMSVQI